MSTNTEPAQNSADSADPSADLLPTDDFSEYLLHSKSEIIYLLRALKEQGDRVTVFFNEGKDFLLTEVIGISDNAVLLDVGSNKLMNQRASEAEKLFCVTRHEKVRIQFLLRGISPSTHEGHPAFRAELPETVLRLQRREFFRLSTPIARPLKCLLQLPPLDGKSRVLETTIVDISGGGLAISAAESSFSPQIGDEFASCTVELPEVGTIIANLRVCNVFDVLRKDGSRLKRAGCKFIDLPGPMLNLVQRYIIKMERERKARESGLA